MTYSLLKNIGLLLLLMSPILNATAADTDEPALPAWQTLELEQKAFWATAHSRVELTQAPDDPDLWQLSATSSVVGNSEEVVLTFNPHSDQALQRTRLSQGKDQRFKSFDYQADFILRERRDPGTATGQPPAQWPVSSRKQIAYPTTDKQIVVTDAYALLLLADRLQASDANTAEVIVHTEFNFYRVRMTCGNGIPVAVNYQVAGGDSVKGTRDTRAVALHVSPVGTAVEKADFSLLGLHSDIILFFDKTSGLLVQVRGIAPRIGATRINLKSVNMREPSA